MVNGLGMGLSGGGGSAAHEADASAAHAASAIAFTPNGSIAATDVQAAIQEVRDEAGGGGYTATEVLALIASQVNVSSIGDTYTDTAGDTYAETASQTRMTEGARTRTIIMVLSGHVSAGTGTFQLWNFTDSASLATATTTSTTEALLTQASSQLDTNASDAITIRVKNSGAGGTTTIDGGGIADGEITLNNMTAIGINVASVAGPWIGSISIGVLKTPSTGTLTAILEGVSLNLGLSATYTPPTTSGAGAAFGTAEANSVVTRNPTVKFHSLYLRRSAIGASNRWGFTFSYQIKADDV